MLHRAYALPALFTTLLRLRVRLCAQLWLSGSSSGGRASGALLDGVTPSQRRVLAAARRGAGVPHLGAASRSEARQFPAPHLRNLVLVACHSVYTGLDFTNSEERSSWFLLDYQKVLHAGVLVYCNPCLQI